MSCPLHSNDNSCVGCAKLKIQHLESKLEEARYSATDYAMKLGRANEKLAEARDENEKLYQENIAITRFYTDLCDRLPKGSCETLGHGWYNVEKYIKRRNENTVIKKLKEQGKNE